MAVRHGYGKIAGADALVFAYDTGDVVNSYKGKPATNHLKLISQQYTPVVEDHFILSNGSHEVNIPTLGTRTVKYVDIWNDYNNGSGRCCLSLFSFGTGITAVSPSTTYMYQIVYKTDTGYSHPNYMYRYEYGASGYIKEGGLHSTGRRTHLGDGWYHAWGSFTTDANTTYLNTYLFHYEYATQNKVQVAQVMLTEGSEVIPPRQFIDFEQTRSATEGLLDLTGNKTITLDDATYDSNADIDLDGSNASFQFSTAYEVYDADYSVEAVFKRDVSGVSHGIITDYQYGWWRLKVTSANTLYWNHKLNDSNINSLYSNATIGTAWTHVVITFSKTDGAKMYINGVLDNSNNDTRAFGLSSSRGPRYVGQTRGGAPSSPSEYFNGKIPVVKIYTRPLTTAEVKQNFNHYKTRFSI